MQSKKGGSPLPLLITVGINESNLTGCLRGGKRIRIRAACMVMQAGRAHSTRVECAPGAGGSIWGGSAARWDSGSTWHRLYRSGQGVAIGTHSWCPLAPFAAALRGARRGTRNNGGRAGGGSGDGAVAEGRIRAPVRRCAARRAPPVSHAPGCPCWDRSQRRFRRVEPSRGADSPDDLAGSIRRPGRAAAPPRSGGAQVGESPVSVHQ